MAAELRSQRSLIHGLPNHIVEDEILPRASSWWDCRSIRAVCKGWRGAVESASNRPKRMLAALHRVAGGSGDDEFRLAVSIYDPDTGRWERMPSIPGLPCGAPISARLACCAGRLYILGGRALPSLDFLDSVFALDLRAPKRSWVRCASMIRPRASFSCVAVEMPSGGNCKIVVVGGQGPAELAMASAEVFDVERACWSKLPQLNVPRADSSAGLLVDEDGSSVYVAVVGGYCSLGSNTGEGFYGRLSQTLALQSAELLKLGESSGSGWEYMDEAGQVLRSSCLVVGSGTLQRAHAASFSRCRSRCRGRGKWATVDGKVVAMGRGVEDEEDEAEQEQELMLMGTVGDEEYATKCRLRGGGGGVVVTSLCMKKKGRAAAAMGRAAWEEIHVPFDLVPTVACCAVAL